MKADVVRTVYRSGKQFRGEVINFEYLTEGMPFLSEILNMAGLTVEALRKIEPPITGLRDTKLAVPEVKPDDDNPGMYSVNFGYFRGDDISTNCEDLGIKTVYKSIKAAREVLAS